MSKGESKEYRTRLKEITSVLHKYGITRGITPQKLRMILEDLGPTYIKIGQIMSLHSDILPKRYCDELMCLRSEVTPMEFPEVKEVIEQAYGCPWNEIFAFISDTPLGSASIAQVHRAELLSGEQEEVNNLFGGGTGGGLSLTPVGFLVVGNGTIRMVPVSEENSIYDRIIDAVPTAIDKISEIISSAKGKSNVVVDHEPAEPDSYVPDDESDEAGRQC